jgi:hypothetical protein
MPLVSNSVYSVRSLGSRSFDYAEVLILASTVDATLGHYRLSQRNRPRNLHPNKFSKGHGPYLTGHAAFPN